MEVRILQMFHDKADYTKVYLVGETYTFDDARAEALIVRGLVECAEEPEKPVEVEEVIPAPETSIEPLFASEKPVKPVATKRKSANKDN